jgi:hypothetical protein
MGSLGEKLKESDELKTFRKDGETCRRENRWEETNK